MTKTEVLRQLKKIDFHDIPVKSIYFKTEHDLEFVIEFFLYNEENNDYDEMILRFEKVEHLTTDKLILDKKSDIEITKFDYHYSNEFECKIQFLLGFAQPSYLVELQCQNIDVNLKPNNG